MKRALIAASALAVGTAVAVSGVIGFVGLVVPHFARLLLGPDHRYCLLACALIGPALLTGADLAARTLVAPAEPPSCVTEPFVHPPALRRNEMQERARCEPMFLAEQGCCKILLCPRCNAVHLHIGPVSFKLSTEAFRQVSAAMAEAEEAVRRYQPKPRSSESGWPF